MSAVYNDFLVQDHAKIVNKSFFKKKSKKKQSNLAREDVYILATLEKLSKDLENVHHALNAVTDPDLIDSFIHEMNALNMRYKVFLNMCKDRGLVSAIF